MFPPQILTDDQRKELHGRYVYRDLVKKLSELTKHFTSLNYMCADEPNGSVVIALASTFERPAARCVSVAFKGATANVAYDDFSRGYDDNTTRHTAQVDVSDMKIEEAVDSIVTAMAKAEPVLGYHIRSQREQANRLAEAERQRWAAFSGRHIT